MCESKLVSENITWIICFRISRKSSITLGTYYLHYYSRSFRNDEVCDIFLSFCSRLYDSLNLKRGKITPGIMTLIFEFFIMILKRNLRRYEIGNKNIFLRKFWWGKWSVNLHEAVKICFLFWRKCFTTKNNISTEAFCSISFSDSSFLMSTSDVILSWQTTIQSSTQTNQYTLT